ncbi:uncharacterized protein LOC143445921 [Clavelina lepadiformis]|uniref:uncharacterized protein LOC143445921 n=1 Tax=Clavelina lepadiformis TaxID=159417 RepID=UPI00404195BD
MTDVGNKVVFLIHPNFNNPSKKDAKLWKDAVFSAVIRIITYFKSIPLSSAHYNPKDRKVISPGSKLKWGYKFAGDYSTRNGPATEFKSFEYKSFADFHDTLNDSIIEDTDASYNSHTLLDSFTAMVHDFQWEEHEIVSPVKPVRKRTNRGKDRSCKKKRLKQNLDEANEDSSGKNYLFIIGSAPKSQANLDEYFEWHVKTVSEMKNVLMPMHLAHHFREKHNIRIFWLDANEIFNENPIEDSVGNILMEKFLNTNKGCMIPLPMLGINKHLLSQNVVLQQLLAESFQVGSKTKTRKCKPTTSQPRSTIDKTKPCCSADTAHNENNGPLQNTGSQPLWEFFPVSSILSFFLNKPFQSTWPKDQDKYVGSIAYSHEENGETVGKNILVKVKNAAKFNLTHYQLYCQTLSQCQSIQSKILSKDSNIDRTHQNEIDEEKIVMPNELMRNCANVYAQNELDMAAKTTVPQEVNFRVIGQTLASLVPLKHISNTNYVYVTEDSKHDFVELFFGLQDHKNVIYVESTCKFCKEKSLLMKDCSILHQFGVLQPLSNSFAIVNWLSDVCNKDMVKFLAMSLDHQDGDISLEARELFEKISSYVTPLENKEKDPLPEAETDELVQSPIKMIEPWHKRLPTLSDISTLGQELQLAKPPEPIRCAEEIELNITELQKMPEDISSPHSNTNMKEISPRLPTYVEGDHNWKAEFSCWEDVVDFVSTQYEVCLNDDDVINQPSLLKEKASHILETMIQFFEKQDNKNIANEFDEILEERVYVSASAIRNKNMSAENTSLECMLQILLRMEWYCYKSASSDILNSLMETILQLLRVISVTKSIEIMKKFMKETLVKYYSSSCGKILHDIFNDLMLPIPEVLETFSPELDDSFLEPISNMADIQQPNTDPFSVVSSVGSEESYESFTVNRQVKLRRTSHIKPMVTRQIAMPANKRKNAKSKTTKPNKSRPFQPIERKVSKVAKTSRSLPVSRTPRRRSKCQVSEEVIRVRRDLFASPSKSTRSKTRLSKPEPVMKAVEKPRRKTSVVDTPAAKQRLTALTRQRIRMRRSQEGSSGKDSLSETIIEESPMKPEEEPTLGFSSQTIVKKSPRHSIMLTRRHSFYGGGIKGKSRTVARAEVIQQHKEVAPPTPADKPSLIATKEKNNASMASPRSLLFSYSSSGKNNTVSVDGKTSTKSHHFRRKLNLLTDSPHNSFPKMSATPSSAVGLTDFASKNDAKKPSKVNRSVLKSQSKSATSEQPKVDPQSVNENSEQNMPSTPKQSKLCSSSRTPSKSMQTTAVCDNVFVTPNKRPPQKNKLKTPTTPLESLPFSSYQRVEPARKPELQSIKLSADHVNPASELPKLRHGISLQTDEKIPLGDVLRSPPQLVAAGSTICRRSPRFLKECKTESLPKIQSHGPIDKYVVRTPSPKFLGQTRKTPVSQSKRKPSPNGDHIRRWPRKKRISDNPSPGVIKKRRKREVFQKRNESSQASRTDHQSETKVNSCGGESPDLGIWIVSDTNSNQRSQKVKPSDEVSPGVEVNQLFTGIPHSECKFKTNTIETPKKNLGPDILDEMGVYPLRDAGEVSTSAPFARWKSPRTRLKGTLFCPRLGSPTSTRRVPMVLLDDNQDQD